MRMLMLGTLVACNLDSTLPASDDARDIDASAVVCDPAAAFETVVPVGGLASGNAEFVATFTPDELTTYFSGQFPKGQDSNVYTASRSSIGEPFEAPIALSGDVNSAANDGDPMITIGELTLLFTSDRDVGVHIYVATRTTTFADFGPASMPVNLNSSTATDIDARPFLSANGNEVWFSSNRSGQFDIYRSVKNGGSFDPASAVAELNSADNDEAPVVSDDGLTVYVSSSRSGSQATDIWMSQRPASNVEFSPPTLVLGVNSAANDSPSWISPDNCRLYLFTNREGTPDVYVATRTPQS